MGSRSVLLTMVVMFSIGPLLSCSRSERIPWQTSRVTGAPDVPPPFVAKQVFPNVKFKEPVSIVHVPSLDRFFVCTRAGLLSSFQNRPDAKPELAFDFPKQLNRETWPPTAHRVQVLYSIAFHPRFAENRYCYVCYALRRDLEVDGLRDGARISRFRVTDSNPPQLDPNSEEIVLAWEQGGHNGCDLQFGPDGYLYISTGDGRPPSPPDAWHTGQDITDLMSSILRIDVDRREGEKKYGIPEDNPFIGVMVEDKAARPEVWAYGFRNPWRMSFDRVTGELWTGDVGWELWEMIHRVEKGGNYGWSVVEGRQLVNADETPGPTPIRVPMIELPHTIAGSVTGGYVYRGKKFPELEGAYIFGDFATRRMWAARFEGEKLVSLDEITRPDIRIISFGQDASGELYYMDFDNGQIYTLERGSDHSQNKDFPTTLSDTGLFESVQVHSPASGVIPYEINASLWHDGATVERWLALPESTAITLYPDTGKPMPSRYYARKFPLHFPKDAVLLKTLAMDLEVGDPNSRRRIETQLLHFDGTNWRAYSYKWREDQSDADLVSPEGDEQTLSIRDAAHPSGSYDYVWRFHDRVQCMTCHNEWAKFTLGFDVPQLNREVDDAAGRVNQLVRLCRTGHLIRRSHENEPQPKFDKKNVASQPRIPNPFDPTDGSLNDRARGYLHANCSHCHRYGGGGLVGLSLVFDKPLAETGALVAPIRGDFGLPEPRVVAPGSFQQSTMYYRMSKFGRDRMPHIGAELPDESGLRLIADWITSLDSQVSPSGQLPPPAEYAEALRQPQVALLLARALGRSELPLTERDELIKAVQGLEVGAVRDLFEGYLPSNGEQRKLGPRPKAATILSLTGEAERGQSIFLATTSKCVSCHKVGDQGINLGPELTRIAEKRSRDELLDSLINPSRTIEPNFATYQVLTRDGRSTIGLLVRRSTNEIVLRDAQNKEVVIAASDVDRVSSSHLSLMPDGLLGGFTAQEAADLLAFLLSLR